MYLPFKHKKYAKKVAVRQKNLVSIQNGFPSVLFTGLETAPVAFWRQKNISGCKMWLVAHLVSEHVQKKKNCFPVFAAYVPDMR